MSCPGKKVNFALLRPAIFATKLWRSGRGRSALPSLAMAVQEGRVLLVHNAQESAVLRDKKSVRRLQFPFRSVCAADRQQ